MAKFPLKIFLGRHKAMPTSRSYIGQISHFDENEWKKPVYPPFLHFFFFCIFASFFWLWWMCFSRDGPASAPMKRWAHYWLLCFPLWQSFFIKLFDADLLCEFIQTFLEIAWRDLFVIALFFNFKTQAGVHVTDAVIKSVEKYISSSFKDIFRENFAK